MTALAYPADSWLSTARPTLPSYPESSSFSLREILALVFSRDPAIRVSFTSSEPRWLVPVLSQLFEFVALPENWDSYGGRPLTRENLEVALQVLEQVMEVDTEPPWVVPLPSGGVQFEWHREGLDAEIVIDRASSMVLITTETGDEELPMFNGIVAMRQLMPRLAIH